MKVSFDVPFATQQAEGMTISYEPASSTTGAVEQGYRLDIAKTVMDDAAYGQGKTTLDVSSDAIEQELMIQRNYTAVMSNSMSAEDYRRMQEEGYPPASTDADTSVTIVDRIKAELAESGTIITGYNDDLSFDELCAITGSAGMAGELEKAFRENDVPLTKENVHAAADAMRTGSELSDITEATQKYIIENKKPVTLENLYVARHSTVPKTRQGQGYFREDTPGYYSRKATAYDWKSLEPQIEKVIEEASLPLNEDTLGDARFMIEEGIPLDAEGLRIAGQVRRLQVPFSPAELAEFAADAIADGRKPMEASLHEGGSIRKRAMALVKDAGEITDEALATVVTKGYTLTLSQLIHETKRTDSERKDILPKTDASVIRARRKLEECRLHLSVRSGMQLMRMGYQLETKPMEDVIEQLKALEAKENVLLTGAQDNEEAERRLNLSGETLRKADQLRRMPAAVLGKLITPGSVFTLNYAHVQGSVLESEYHRAGMAYEALSTEIRPDLGDSIQKAFRNVDDILKDLKLETSDANRRAVRILGYNSMMVTEGNVQAVKLADLRLSRVIRKLTPQSTLRLIREGVNPLNTDISKLDDILTSYKKEETDEFQSMSKFLYKLEKNDEIGESEREAYIGIYRLLHQIEESDGAVIGQLMNQGAEVNFRNLLQAVRTRKSENEGFLKDSVLLNSISTQIEAGFLEYQRSLARESVEQLTPERLKKVHIDESTTLEALSQALSETPQDEEVNARYEMQELNEMRTVRNVEDQVIQKLLDYKIPVTFDNLQALNYLSSYRGVTFRRLSEAGDEDFDKAGEELKNHFDSEEEALTAYEALSEASNRLLKKQAEEPGVRSIDLKSLSLYSKQIRMAVRLAKEEDYEIPIEMKTGATSINLRILHGQKESGTVRMTMDTEEYGAVEGRFTIREGRVEGYVGYQSIESREAMEGVLNDFLRRIQGMNLVPGEIHALHSSNLRIREHVPNEGDAPSTKELYGIAKALIFSLETL